MNPEALFDPVVQYGFAGLAAGLLAVLVWLISRLLALLESTGEVVSNNTDAVQAIESELAESRRLTGELRDRLLSRPCLRPRD